MKTKFIATALSAALLMTASSGFADSSRHYQQDYEAAMYYDYAKVTRVEPVYGYGPSRDCGYQPAALSSGGNGKAPVTAMVVGGLVGGLVGSQIAGNGNHTVGAVAGAATGATAGYFIGRGQDGETLYAYDDGCREQRHRSITGYDVTYKYGGQTFHSRLPYDPGKRLRLQVALQPDL